MKVRSSNLATAYTALAPARPARPAQPVAPAGPVAAPGGAAPAGDVASVAGIPAAELTPKVQAALGQLMAEVSRLREELERAQKRVGYLEELADQDTLTPVFNRRAFVRELTRMMSFAERYGMVGSVVYFDVNGMKEINDGYGHGAGDAALAHVARTMLAQLRESDVVGRLGGDEFGVILPQADHAAASAKGLALAEAIAAQAFEFEGQWLRVGVAYGVHTFAAGDQAQAALDAADRAMYAQKNDLEVSARG